VLAFSPVTCGKWGGVIKIKLCTRVHDGYVTNLEIFGVDLSRYAESVFRPYNYSTNGVTAQTCFRDGAQVNRIGTAAGPYPVHKCLQVVL
jgi:hypothetical protein